MRVRDETRECVVYVGRFFIAADGREAMRPAGTAFLVSVPSESQEGRTVTYLVTAKHVAIAVAPSELAIRVNVAGAGGGATFLRAGNDNFRWWFHPTEEAVDVAVLPFGGIAGNSIAHRSIPLSMFLSDELIAEKNIGIGDEVFLIGLFIHLSGSHRNQPIVRMGNIAMMPEEKVATSLGMMDAHLIEARSIGGLSGSPVFVRETVDGHTGAAYFLGLAHGHWDIPLESRDDVMADVPADWFSSVNMGIGIVVPASKVREVLYQEGLVEMRNKSDERAAG